MIVATLVLCGFFSGAFRLGRDLRSGAAHGHRELAAAASAGCRVLCVLHDPLQQVLPRHNLKNQVQAQQTQKNHSSKSQQQNHLIYSFIIMTSSTRIQFNVCC